MAIQLIKHSETLWEWKDGNTSLMALDSANSVVKFGVGMKVGNLPAGRFAAGTLTNVTASDTVVTGLTTVSACGASWGTDPADANFIVSATIGDQAGAPAAGSILVKSWKTDGTDPTPAAATSFSKVINWWAFGS